MMNLNDFDRCVVVMAHPDDEILWASSVLGRARKIIICYSETPASDRISSARRNVFRDYPLKTVVNLDIVESNTYQSTNWHRPIENQYGILCGRNREAYARNFHALTDALREHLEDGDVVVTHNPWGEYGHEEHVQVFRAVSHLRRQRDFRLHVTNYVSDRVIYFMEKNVSRLASASALLPTDAELCAKLKQHYQNHRCWTWNDNYEWPAYECFYEVSQPDAPLRSSRKAMSSLPMNVIWLDEQATSLRRVLGRLKRRCSAFMNGVFFGAALIMSASPRFDFVL